jgi:hypothetical protein
MIIELASDKVLLSQIEEDFNGSGALNAKILKKDLLNRGFLNCIFEWGQS